MRDLRIVYRFIDFLYPCNYNERCFRPSATWCIPPDSFQEDRPKIPSFHKKKMPRRILPSQGIMFSLFGDVLARRLAWIPQERRVSRRGDEQSVSRTGQPRSWWQPAQRSLPAKVVVARNDRWGSRIPGWLPAGERAPQSTSKNVRRRLERSSEGHRPRVLLSTPHEYHRYRHINPVRRYPEGGEASSHARLLDSRFETDDRVQCSGRKL